MAAENPNAFKITGARLYSHDLFTPRAYEADGVAKGPPRYSLRLVLKNDNPCLPKLKALAVKVAEEAGLQDVLARFAKDPKAGGLFHPFQKGSDIIQTGENAGRDMSSKKALLENALVFTARSKHPPRVAQLIAGLLVETKEEDLFFRGANMAAVVVLNGYDTMGGGVNAWLNDALALPGGERVGGQRQDLASIWADLVVEETEAF